MLNVQISIKLSNVQTNFEISNVQMYSSFKIRTFSVYCLNFNTKLTFMFFLYNIIRVFAGCFFFFFLPNYLMNDRLSVTHVRLFIRPSFYPFFFLTAWSCINLFFNCLLHMMVNIWKIKSQRRPLVTLCNFINRVFKKRKEKKRNKTARNRKE